MVLIMMNVHAQLPPNVVRENFEDDTATTTAAGRYNVIPGENPDEDWYLFLPVSSNCDQGHLARLHVGVPQTAFQITWDSNVLISASNDKNINSVCTRNIYQLVNDVPAQVSEFEITWGHGEPGGFGEHGGHLDIEGDGGIIARFCVSGLDWRLVTQIVNNYCDQNGAQFYGQSGGEERVDLNWKIDWDAQTVTVTILDTLTGTLQENSPKTASFLNPNTNMELLEVTTFGGGTAVDEEAFQFIDNYVLKDLVTTETNETVPSEFDTGIVAFAKELGFKTPQSQQLFALFLIGISTLIAALFSRFASEGKFKNYVIHGTSVIVGAFCVYTEMIQLWMTFVAIVMSSAFIKGATSIINTYKSGGFFNPDTPTKNEEFVPGITTNIGEFGPEGTGPEAAQERQRRIDEQVKQELREKRQAEESA